MDRERMTVDRMIRIYCRGNHGTLGELCEECSELLAYAGRKLDKCPFQENKPTCGRCHVHCYRKEMRERVVEVMRYAGPRMFSRHPWLSLLHFLDRFHKPPGLRQRE
jgi:hypothetical protein